MPEDSTREGLVKTPEEDRKSDAILPDLWRYTMNANTGSSESALFREDVSEMVIVKDIELYSVLEHHMLPFCESTHCLYPQRFISPG